MLVLVVSWDLSPIRKIYANLILQFYYFGCAFSQSAFLVKAETQHIFYLFRFFLLHVSVCLYCLFAILLSLVSPYVFFSCGLAFHFILSMQAYKLFK